MVKLTPLLIKKKCLQQQSFKSITKEIEKGHIKKITHLFMDEQCIDEIDDFSKCKNLKVIYLQRNSIQRIENIDFAINLTHLYLQHNEIRKIENLDLLINLKKLYLGYNNISVIEGLDKLIKLSDLHIEKQRLGIGERMCFDPRTAFTLSGCLKYLNISGNKLNSLSEVRYFEKLTTLEAKDNLIYDIEDLTETISTLQELERLFLQGNPVTKIYRYKENLIANSNNLYILDDKRITENSRIFLKKFKTEKLHQSRRQNEIPLSEDITNSLNLPPAFRKSVSRAMFQTINPKFSFSNSLVTGDTQALTFAPWTKTSSLNIKKDNHVLPRPFWKNKITRKSIEKDNFSDKNVTVSSILKKQ